MRGELEGLSIVVRKWYIWANSVVMAFISKGGKGKPLTMEQNV
jgi:hypothetical protein